MRFESRRIAGFGAGLLILQACGAQLELGQLQAALTLDPPVVISQVFGGGGNSGFGGWFAGFRKYGSA